MNKKNHKGTRAHTHTVVHILERAASTELHTDPQFVRSAEHTEKGQFRLMDAPTIFVFEKDGGENVPYVAAIICHYVWMFAAFYYDNFLLDDREIILCGIRQ